MGFGIGSSVELVFSGYSHTFFFFRMNIPAVIYAIAGQVKTPADLSVGLSCFFPDRCDIAVDGMGRVS
jgi:hypothetical protein